MIPHLRKAEKAGMATSLRTRPTLLPHHAYVVSIYRELGGADRFSDVAEFCRAAGIGDVMWLWRRLCAVREVANG